MGRWYFTSALFACSLALCAGAVGCATTPVPAPVSSTSLSDAQEAQAIEAAKQHPIAQPRQRSLYPEQAPTPIPAHGPPLSAPPGMDPAARAYDGPSPEPNAWANTVAPSAPPTDYVDSPQYAAPGSGYVWAPGYWSWSGTTYIWVGGDWLRSRPGYSYVGPRWSHTAYGWELSPGGWARGGGLVVYPVNRYPYRPYREYYNPGYYGSRRTAPPAYPARHDDSGFAPSRSSGAASRSMLDTNQRGGDDSRSSRPSIAGRADRAGRSDGMRAPAPSSAPSVSRPSSGSGPAAAPSVNRAVRVDGGARPSQRATVRTRR